MEVDIKRVEALYELVIFARNELKWKVNYLKDNRNLILALNFRDQIRLTIPRIPAMPVVKFKPFNEFNGRHWINLLIEEYDKILSYVREQEEPLTVFLKALDHLADCYSLRLPNRSIKSPRQCCFNCTRCVLTCTYHRYSSNNSALYINRQLNNNIPSGGIPIAIDLENIHTKQNGKNSQIPFRIAVVAANPSQRNNPTLIYHSYWEPTERDMWTYKHLIGCTTNDIRLQIGSGRFANRNEAKEILVKEIIKDRILVFANARDDVKTLALSIDNEIRDIQDYFCRFPDTNHKEPLSLKWLSRHILFTDIQEYDIGNNHHDPTIDAICTLKLYEKIPKDFWTRYNVDLQEIPEEQEIDITEPSTEQEFMITG